MNSSKEGCSAFPSIVGLFRLLIVAMGILLGHVSVAQGWELAIGGASYDEGNAIAEAVDGGFIVVGFSESFGADGDLDVLVVRTDIDGNVLWQQAYDLGFTEHGFDVLSEPDGTFLIVGDVSLTPGDPLNVLLMRVTKEGKTMWTRQYPSTFREVGRAIARTSDGGYLIAGNTTATTNGKDDILLIKVDAQGNLQWRRNLGTEGDDYAQAIVAVANGFVIAANSDSPQGIDSDILLYKINSAGEPSWPAPVRIATPEADEVFDLIVARDADLILAGRTGFGSDAYLARLDPEGNKRWEKTIGGPLFDVAYSVIELANGDLVITGQTEVNASNADMLMAGFDAAGNEKWRSVLGKPDVSEEGRQLVSTIDGRYSVIGLRSNAFTPILSDMYLVKTDGLGNTITNYVAGRVYRDADQGCNGYDLTRDTPLANWLVRVSNPDRSYYGTTDAGGNYSILVDTGSYSVSVLPANPYWKNCVENGYDITLDNFYDTTRLNFPILPTTICPYLEVDISTPFLATCSEIVYTIAYCNNGTGPARDAYVEVTLDEELTFLSSSIPVARQDSNVYTFNLGDVVSTGCGNFSINTRLACEGIADGQAGLISARIYPDMLCVDPDPQWDRSSVVVSGICRKTPDTAYVEFRISNVGDGDMEESRNYIVVEDNIIFLNDASGNSGLFQLEAGRSKLIPIDQMKPGSTYRLIAEQSPFHPGRNFPTAFVEGCVLPGDNYSTGFATSFPENDRDPNIAIDVQEIVGSDQSVYLRGYPKGYSDSSLIADNTDLTYTIFFRNIGADSINRVVIRDTLSPNLDIATVVPGASNLPYDFEIYDNGILKITFSDIELLPGGSNGDAGSYGFVKFRVSQKPNNPVGTVIENRAAVFFDYLVPVQTNPVKHNVGDYPTFVEVITDTDQVFWPGVKINVYPNPFMETVTFNIEGYAFKDMNLKVFDATGRLLHSSRHNGNDIMYYRRNLPSGLYFYRLESEGQLINSGKLLVR